MTTLDYLCNAFEMHLFVESLAVPVSPKCEHWTQSDTIKHLIT